MVRGRFLCHTVGTAPAPLGFAQEADTKLRSRRTATTGGVLLAIGFLIYIASGIGSAVGYNLDEAIPPLVDGPGVWVYAGIWVASALAFAGLGLIVVELVRMARRRDPAGVE